MTAGGGDQQPGRVSKKKAASTPPSAPLAAPSQGTRNNSPGSSSPSPSASRGIKNQQQQQPNPFPTTTTTTTTTSFLPRALQGPGTAPGHDGIKQQWPIAAVVAAFIILIVLGVAMGSLYQKHKGKQNREKMSAEDMRRKRLALFQDHQGITEEAAEQSAAQRRTPSAINSDHSPDTAAAEDDKTENFSKQAPPSSKRKTTTPGRACRVGHKPEAQKEGKERNKSLDDEDYAGAQRKPECPLSSMATNDGDGNERDGSDDRASDGDPSLPPAIISKPNPSEAEPVLPSASAVGVEPPSQSNRDSRKQEKVLRPMPSSPSSGSAQGVDLPGGMQLDGLLELLRSGPRVAFDAIAGVVSPTGHGDESSPGGRLAGRGSPADICSRWWDAAYGAGDTDAATVAVEAFSLQLGLIQDDVFTSADEQRAAILVAFLRASPHPLMVRLVLLANPTAALSALRLAITVRPLQRGSKYTSPSLLESASGEPARVVDATLRIESFEPLEGLDSLVELLQSPAGSVALSTVLGLEAKQEYAHGADLEAHSCLGPLLAALPCALSLKEHTRVSTDTIEETLAGTSIALPPERVPVAHRLAKMVTELKDPQAGLHRSGLMHKFEAYLKQVSRNRYAFVDLTHAALVKAMTTKGLAKEIKSDVCAWLTKAVYLHESLPRLCDEQAPELLGELRPGITSASSAFLMSLSALLLRLGSWKFANTDNEILDSIDPSYLEFGSVRFESGVSSASDVLDDDEPERDGRNKRKQDIHVRDKVEEDNVGVEEGWTAATSTAEDGRGIEEAKGEPIPGFGSDDDGDTVQVAAFAADAAGGDGGAPGSRTEEPVRNREDSNAPLIGQAHEHQASPAAASVPAGASSGVNEDSGVVFSFATELFFLTHRALEVIVSSMRRREAEAHRVLNQIAVSNIGASISDNVDEEAGTDARVIPALERSQRLIFKEANDALYYGWAVEGLGSDDVMGVTVQFANFTARWLERYIRHRDDIGKSRNTSYSPPLIGDNTVETPTARAGTLGTIPHAFIATMCDTWVSASRRGRQGKFFSPREANNAASVCGRLMERVDLRFSAPTQAKLVDVLEEFIQTGERSLELSNKGRRLQGRRNNGFGSGPGEGFDEVRRGRSGGFQGSIYWGAQRGFAGAIMDDEKLRQVLPRQLMVLYAEGLVAEYYFFFSKYGVRMRIGNILLKLWMHPLGEPRQAMLALFRDAIPHALAASTAAAAITTTTPSDVAPDVNHDGPTGSNSVASDFLYAVFDGLFYFMNDARGRLKDGVIEERSNGGRELSSKHPNWTKYAREREQCKGGLSNMVLPNLQLLQTLCTEHVVLDLLREGKLGLRSASIISLILQTLYGEEAAEYAVVDPPSWGIEKPKLGGLACQLLAGLAGPGIKKTKAFATILKSIDADFDSRLLEATAIAPGCKCLRGAVITRLALALELEGERMKVRDAEKAMSGVGRRGDGGGPMLADDPFEGVPEDIDAEEFVKGYGEALRDLVHTQVESLSPGHNYDRRREGATLNTPRKVASELSRKLPKMLPNPPHPDSSIFAILEEDALNFARFVITGPVDTPYEGGLFVFDVFLPQTYPADPPLVSMITTGQGTVKFNPNLYSDGKVCLSLLGKGTGASVAGSDKWDPEKSSLWQVFASIQTQVMTEDPYYNQGGGRDNMRGRGTDETEKASEDENARITLETIRHAAVANLRTPPRGCEEVIRIYFRTMRNRILRRCKDACERAPNERIGKAMLKASMELRVELDRLEEKSK